MCKPKDLCERIVTLSARIAELEKDRDNLRAALDAADRLAAMFFLLQLDATRYSEALRVAGRLSSLLALEVCDRHDLREVLDDYDEARAAVGKEGGD